MTIRELHKLAYARMPKHEVHDRLHEMAEGIGVASLRDCTPAQLDELARHVGMIPLRTQYKPADAGSSPITHHSAYGPRERGTGGDTLKRSRTGSTAGTIRIATRKQKRFCQNLASEIGWTDEQFSKWLRKQFEVGSIEEIGTTQRANEAIRRLLHIRREKAVGR